MTYGVTENGYIRKTADIILAEKIADLKARFGDNIRTTGDSVFGSLMASSSLAASHSEEVVEQVYYSQWRDTATGDSLDNANALVNSSRVLSEYSTVTLTLGTDGEEDVTIPSGSIAKQSENGIEWETLQDAIIPAEGTIGVSARCRVTGPYSATTGSIDTPVTIINGWDSVTNAGAATAGRNRETDSQFRTRTEENLNTASGGALEAIKAKLRLVSGVTFVDGRENRTDETDENDLPPHSYNFVVVGGADQDIADELFRVGGAGIQTYGDTPVNVTDDFGNTLIINFDRADNLTIYYVVNITHTSDYPENGSDLIKSALVEYGESLVNGDDVLHWKSIASLNDIPGITAITLTLGTAPAPVGTSNISVSNVQKAYILAANITVND